MDVNQSQILTVDDQPQSYLYEVEVGHHSPECHRCSLPKIDQKIQKEAKKITNILKNCTLKLKYLLRLGKRLAAQSYQVCNFAPRNGDFWHFPKTFCQISSNHIWYLAKM